MCVLFPISGEAEAFAIEAKAKAEAEQMAKKADAWKEYKEAAIVDMMLQVSHHLKWIFKSCGLTLHMQGQGANRKSRVTTKMRYVF
jgi:flotillin